MIRVQKAEAPAIAAVIRDKGHRALLELIGSPEASTRPGPKRKRVAERIEDIAAKHLEDYWTEALPDLRRSYRHICAYLGMYIDPVTGLATVDHFRHKAKHPRLAYEWDNFRLAAHQANTDKGDHEDVLDPCEIQDGWFILDVFTGEVDAANTLDVDTRAAVVTTIQHLKLNEPTYCAARRRYHDLYHGLKTEPDDPDEPYPLHWLVHHCPFVARELRRQNRLRPGDMFSDRQ